MTAHDAVTVGDSVTVGRPMADGAIPATVGADSVWCTDVELSAPLPAVPVGLPEQHVRARVLARLHGEPLGYLTAPLTAGSLPPDLLDRLRAQFTDRCAEHLAGEGVVDQTLLGGEPLPGPTAACPNRVVPDRDVSVVVCTRDRGAALAGCLRRLRTLTYPRLEVIVVDNAPGEDSTAQSFQAEVGADPRFRYVVEPRPGLSWARNRGLAEARGDMVAYTDDDVSVDSRWVDAIVRGFQQRPDVGCVTGMVATASLAGVAETYFEARLPNWSTRCDRDLFDLALRPPASRDALYPYSPGNFGTGANFAVRADVMRALGGFDPALGAGTRTAGGEDLDAFVRVLQAGWALAYEPAALVWHYHRSSMPALRRQMYSYGTGFSAFITKHLLDRRTRPEVLRRIPGGLLGMARIPGATGDQLPAGSPVPHNLLLWEFAGFFTGPVLLLQARRRARSLAAVGP